MRIIRSAGNRTNGTRPSSASKPKRPPKRPTPAPPRHREKPSAIKTGVEAGAMASADAVRNMVDGFRAVFGMAPSPGVAKALNVPAKG